MMYCLVGIAAFIAFMGGAGFVACAAFGPLRPWAALRRERKPLPLWCRIWGWGWLAAAQATLIAVVAGLGSPTDDEGVVRYFYVCTAVAVLCWGLAFALRRSSRYGDR